MNESDQAFQAWWAEVYGFAFYNDTYEASWLSWCAALAWKRQQDTQRHSGLADPCADGFCPVDLFRPVDETEGSC